MADIKQAAKWMKEGKSVYDPGGCRVRENEHGWIVFVGGGEDWFGNTEEVLSENWELAEDEDLV